MVNLDLVQDNPLLYVSKYFFKVHNYTIRPVINLLIMIRKVAT